MPQTCPRCSAIVTVAEIGDLVMTGCPACDWEELAIVARVFPEMPRSTSAMVEVRALRPLSATALAALRALSESVRAIPMAQLQERLHSPQGVSLGLQGEYRAKELQSMLVDLGFEAVCMPQLQDEA